MNRPEPTPAVEVVLASSSPRRRALLEQAGIPFRVFVSPVDESAARGGPAAMVRELSWLKANSAADRLQALEGPGRRLIIGADTLISHRGQALGKPLSPQQAVQTLRQLSGRWHRVLTGLTLVRQEGEAVQVRSVTVTTVVCFARLTDEEIYRYVATGEPLDKAGGYGIQARGGLLVRWIVGSYDNVVGLPLHALWREASRLGVDLPGW